MVVLSFMMELLYLKLQFITFGLFLFTMFFIMADVYQHFSYFAPEPLDNSVFLFFLVNCLSYFYTCCIILFASFGYCMNLWYSLFFIFIDLAIPRIIHSFFILFVFSFIVLNGNASLNILHNFSDMIVYAFCAFSLSNTG